jgi:pimeloyl-ACP methyl ester carboxylesterase
VPAHLGGSCVSSCHIERDVSILTAVGRGSAFPFATALLQCQRDSSAACAFVAFPVEGVVKPDLCGHSFGGWISFMASLDSPQLIGRVILLAPGGLNNFHLGKIAGIVSDPSGFGHRVLRKHLGWLQATLIAWATQRLFLTPQSAALLQGWSPEGNRSYHRDRGGHPGRSLLVRGTHDDGPSGATRG